MTACKQMNDFTRTFYPRWTKQPRSSQKMSKKKIFIMKYGLDTDTDVLLRSGSQQSRSQQSQESCWFWWDLISCSHQDINTSKYDQQDIQPHSHWLQFLLQWWITQILRHLRDKYLEVLSYKNNPKTWIISWILKTKNY